MTYCKKKYIYHTDVWFYILMIRDSMLLHWLISLLLYEYNTTLITSLIAGLKSGKVNPPLVFCV